MIVLLSFHLAYKLLRLCDLKDETYRVRHIYHIIFIAESRVGVQDSVKYRFIIISYGSIQGFKENRHPKNNF
jgi:hypothetical protein